MGKLAGGTGPNFSKPLSNATVMEGSPVTLEVEVTGFPEPTLTWWVHIELSHKEGKHALFIHSSAVRDSGQYVVTASNSAGTVTSSSMLQVKAETAPPNFIQRLQSMTVRQGSQVRLDVRVTGIPAPVVKFYREGAEIQSSADFQIVQDGDLYSLLIAEAFPEDSGTYSVSASNSSGRATSTAELLVQGEEEAVPAKKPKTIISASQISQTRQTRVEKVSDSLNIE
uniref:Ig-like domain-containing protein n=1 Tax=Sinocyclocheilus grahami TaxID=75366 RepID=A0A672NVY8_SINGR